MVCLLRLRDIRLQEAEELLSARAGGGLCMASRGFDRLDLAGFRGVVC